MLRSSTSKQTGEIEGAVSFGAFTLLLVLKPLADMFWSVRLLDYALLAFALMLLVFRLPRSTVKFGMPDVCAVLITSLILFSGLRSTEGFSVCIKMISPFILYFLGRIYWSELIKGRRYLLYALALTVLLNTMEMLLGKGFQIWGSARTFSGFYFFKTDLACAMGLAFISWLFLGDGKRSRALICSLAVLLVVLSNTRAYYIVLMVDLLLYAAMKADLRISIRTVFISALGIIAALYFLNWLFSTGIFSNLNFIDFSFTNLSDLFDSSNTQGRNVIWETLLYRIDNASSFERLFGIDLVSDLVVVNGSAYGSHSLYMGMLYNTGICGLSLLFMFMIAVLNCLRKIQDKRFSYFAVAIGAQFLISGLSVHVLQYTGNSWIPFAVVGAMFSYSQLYKNFEPKMPMLSEAEYEGCNAEGRSECSTEHLRRKA